MTGQPGRRRAVRSDVGWPRSAVDELLAGVVPTIDPDVVRAALGWPPAMTGPRDRQPSRTG